MRILMLGSKKLVNHKGKEIEASKDMIDGFKTLESIGKAPGFYGGNAKNVSKPKSFSAQYLVLDENQDIIDIAVDLDKSDDCSKAQLVVFAERYGKIKKKALKGDEKVDEIKRFLDCIDSEESSDESKQDDQIDQMTFDELVAEAEKRKIKFDEGTDVTEELLRESLRKEA